MEENYTEVETRSRLYLEIKSFRIVREKKLVKFAKNVSSLQKLVAGLLIMGATISKWQSELINRRLWDYSVAQHLERHSSVHWVRWYFRFHLIHNRAYRLQTVLTRSQL